jgi:hypothetical protein
MLIALGLASFGAYRRRAPGRHDELVDFGGYRRQVVGGGVTSTYVPQRLVEKQCLWFYVISPPYG